MNIFYFILFILMFLINYRKMKTLSSVLTAEKDRQKLEIESLIKRLSEYDNLPLPDEISARFQNMNEDLSKMSSSLHVINLVI